MSDIRVQCCRCRNQHMESERISRRVDTATDRLSMSELVCPRCGGKSFYDLTEWFAWSWASGLIECGEKPPEQGQDGSGCIVFAKGPRAFLKGVLAVVARHGQGASAGKLLVPGVPEAIGPIQAVDAFIDWVEWCAKGNDKANRHSVTFSRAIQL